MNVIENGETLEQILADLVAFQTVSGDYEAALGCLGYAEARLSQSGMHIVREEYKGFPSLIATSRVTKRPKLLLQAHIDVVSAPESCYRLQEKDGKLLGRGVFDMKFAVAIFLKVVDELSDTLAGYDFGIMLTSDEEVGGKDGVKALLDADYSTQVCLLPDAGDNWSIETSHKACWIAKASTTGTAAHGSRPWEGDNAIDRLVDALCEMRELFDEQQHVNSDTFSINKILGGAVANQVADKAQALIDARFVDDQSHDRLRTKIEKITEKYGVTLDTMSEVKVSKTKIEHPLVAPFLRLAEEKQGQALKPVRSLGLSDAHYFAKHDIPVILVRPAGGAAHADGEWIDQADLQTYFEVVKAYVEEVAAL